MEIGLILVDVVKLSNQTFGKRLMQNHLILICTLLTLVESLDFTSTELEIGRDDRDLFFPNF